MLGVPSSLESSIGSRSEWKRTPISSSSSMVPTALLKRSSLDQRSSDQTRRRFQGRSGFRASTRSRSYSFRWTLPVPGTFSA